MKLRLIILWYWWVHFLSLSKIDVSNVKNCSNHPENCFLFLFANSDNIHSSPCRKIIMSIAYTDKLVAFGLVQIMKGLWMAKLVLLNLLLSSIKLWNEFFNNKIYIYIFQKSCRVKLPPAVRHREDRSSGNCAPDQRFDTHETSLEDRSLQQLQIFFLAYQIVFQQIYQSDWAKSILQQSAEFSTHTLSIMWRFWFTLSCYSLQFLHYQKLQVQDLTGRRY